MVIAARGRDSHINTCLHYLNHAANMPVKVILVYDGIEFKPESFPNLNLEIIYNLIPGPFNKSKLLNIGISKSMDADWISIVDADMIYRPTFFDDIKNALKHNDYIVCHGLKLSKGGSEIAYSRLNCDKLWALPLDPTQGSKGPSQVSMRPLTIEKLIKIFGRETLYHEGFCGWGYEDSDLSHRSGLLQQRGIIRKTFIGNVWRHMWHEPADQTGSAPNAELYNKLFKIDNDIIRETR